MTWQGASEFSASIMCAQKIKNKLYIYIYTYTYLGSAMLRTTSDDMECGMWDVI
jgi:hypothetical protein